MIAVVRLDPVTSVSDPDPTVIGTGVVEVDGHSYTFSVCQSEYLCQGRRERVVSLPLSLQGVELRRAAADAVLSAWERRYGQPSA